MFIYLYERSITHFGFFIFSQRALFKYLYPTATLRAPTQILYHVTYNTQCLLCCQYIVKRLITYKFFMASKKSMYYKFRFPNRKHHSICVFVNKAPNLKSIK